MSISVYKSSVFEESFCSSCGTKDLKDCVVVLTLCKDLSTSQLKLCKDCSKELLYKLKCCAVSISPCVSS